MNIGEGDAIAFANTSSNIFFLGCRLVGAAIYIFLAIILFRFKSLRTKINIFLLHISVVGALQYLWVALFILVVLTNRMDVSSLNLLYTLITTQQTLVFIGINLSTILAVYWYLTVYKPHVIEQVGRYYKYIFIIVYFVNFFELIVHVICARFDSDLMFNNVRLVFFFSVYIISLIIVLILNILTRTVHLESDAHTTSYALLISSIFLLCEFPSAVVIFCTSLGLKQNFWYIVPLIIWILQPALVFLLLANRHQPFKIAFTNFLKRSRFGDNLENVNDEHGTVNTYTNFHRDNTALGNNHESNNQVL